MEKIIFAIGEKVIAAVREEHFSFVPSENIQQNSITGVMEEKTFMGDHTEYVFAGGNQKIGVRSTLNVNDAVGSERILFVNRGNTMVLKKS